ncbi:MAG TPA: hypothetical protein VFT45_15875 [Longimicrobium sp.]|nr:hypothetical protein [Longimicrobium sp.]
MSESGKTPRRNKLDRFLDDLRRLTNRYGLEQEVDVLVHVLETSALAATSERLREAEKAAEQEETEQDETMFEAARAAAGRRCNPRNPRCPRGSRCMLRAGSLEFRCFP